MKYLPFFVTFSLVLLFVVGCGESRPSNLPPLAPCKIKVHDSGRPLSEIAISFRRIEGQAGWSLNAQTGADGIAVAQTIAGSFRAKGIPIGSYRVSLSERIELPPELIISDEPGATLTLAQMEDITKKQQMYHAERRVLPEILCDPSKAPLELTVTNSGAELDVDISKFK